MRRRDLAALGATALLLTGYVAAAEAALHPHVGPSYRRYYISHETVEWHTQSYRSTLADGIRFARNGKPTFVRSMQGLSRPEAGGRWTDARLHPWAVIHYKQPLVGRLCILLKVAPSPANLGGISYLRVGAESRAFTTPVRRPSWQRFDLTAAAPTDAVEVLPGRTERHSARDPREIGLALARLVVRPGPC